MRSRLISAVTTTWQRLVGAPAPSGVAAEPARRSVKVRDLAWRDGDAAVWPVEWVDWTAADPSGSVPETGVLESFTRLGNRLLLRINVGGHRRTAGLEWDAPPRVADVEAVLQANLGAEIRTIGQLEVPIRVRTDRTA